MTGIIVIVVAVLVVLLTALLRNVEWSGRVTTVLATVLSVVGGVVTAFAANGWDVSQFGGADVLSTALAIYGSSQLLYNLILKGTSPIETLDSVDIFTSKE